MPLLLAAATVLFHAIRVGSGVSMESAQAAHWVFPWSEQVVRHTPLYSTWAHFGGSWMTMVSWHTIYHACPVYMISAVIIGT